MGVRKQSEQNIRKLTKLGGKSLAVTLPVELVGELKWKEKQRVVVKKKGTKLIISDFKVKKKK